LNAGADPAQNVLHLLVSEDVLLVVDREHENLDPLQAADERLVERSVVPEVGKNQSPGLDEPYRVGFPETIAVTPAQRIAMAAFQAMDANVPDRVATGAPVCRFRSSHHIGRGRRMTRFLESSKMQEPPARRARY
jgi:hypothetical protein